MYLQRVLPTIILWFIALTSSAFGLRRIYGAGSNVVNIENQPYHVGILKQFLLVCSGSIIAEEYALTEATCVYNNGRIPAAELKVKCGTQEWADCKSGTLLKVKSYYIHPDYPVKDNLAASNYAVLRVIGRFPLSNKVSPIKLFISTHPKGEGYARFAGEPFTISGWGFNEGNIPSGYLVTTNITAVSMYDCFGIYQHFSKLELGTIVLGSNTICAQSKGRGMCQMDFGGPVVYKGVQIAMTYQMTRKCADKDYPDVYTKVQAFKPWIDEFTGKTVKWVTEASHGASPPDFVDITENYVCSTCFNDTMG